MKQFTILCPTDFSECSLNAVEYATKLGEHYQAKLILFHVPNKKDYQKLIGGEKEMEALLFAQIKIDNLVKAVQKEGLKNGLKSCEGVIKKDVATTQAILDFTDSQGVDLIIMGTEGINQFKQNFVGTKASNIVKKANCDVLIIPRKVFYKVPRKLVYATDYLEEDKLAIQKVVEIAKFYSCEIDVVHVGTKAKTIDKALHKTMVSEISPFVKYEKINYVLKTYRDDPSLGLESYLNMAKGDILFTLSRKKSWFETLFTKNLSRKMSYFINKPLFVIKSV